MGTVTLKLRGLSVCYLKQNEDGEMVWKVFFPYDPGHKLTLKANSLSGNPQLGGQKGVFVKVTPLNAVDPGKKTNSLDLSAYKGANSETILDLTGNLLHKDGLELDSKFAGDWKKSDVVMMEIPFAVLSVAQEDISQTEYILTDKDGKALHTLSNIAISGTMEIECAGIEIKGGGFSGGFRAGEVIILDNDCQQHKDPQKDADRNPADIAMVYDFLKDTSKGQQREFGMKLASGAAPSETIPCNLSEITHPASIAALP